MKHCIHMHTTFCYLCSEDPTYLKNTADYQEQVELTDKLQCCLEKFRKFTTLQKTPEILFLHEDIVLLELFLYDRRMTTYGRIQSFHCFFLDSLAYPSPCFIIFIIM